MAIAHLVPIAIISVFMGIRVSEASGERASIHEQTELARAALWPVDLIAALRNERIWAPLDMFSLVSRLAPPVEGYDETRAQTDAALSALSARLAAADADVRGALEPALAGLDQLDALRAEIDAFRRVDHESTDTIAFGFDVYDRYTVLVSPFYEAQEVISGRVEESRLREGAGLANAVGRSIETTSQLAVATIDTAVLSEGGVDQRDEITTLSVLSGSLNGYLRSMETSDRYYAALGQVIDGQAASGGVGAIARQAIVVGNVPLEGLVDAVNLPQNEGLYAYQDRVHELVGSWADTLEARADARVVRPLALTAASIVLGAAVSVLATRSVTRRLRELTQQATDVAGRLPPVVRELNRQPMSQDIHPPSIENVRIDEGGELGAVADALNSVQLYVLDAAGQEAVLRRGLSCLVVSFGIRNQDLLSREAELISGLAAVTTRDDDRTHVARLGRLAARLRRNGESLLAVAGVDESPRPGPPVELGGMLRGVLAELEPSPPVPVVEVEPALLGGQCAADLADVVAELLEQFPRGMVRKQPIDVRGEHVRGPGGYRLAITDPQSRLSPEDVLAADRWLTDDEHRGGAASSSDVGHFVTGLLARRAGFLLRVSDQPGAGVTTTICLPPDVVRRLPASSALSRR